MKKCTKCGKAYGDTEFFCEECGGTLEVVEVQVEKKRSVVPIIIGCSVAVGILVMGTVIGVGMIKGKTTKNQQETNAMVQQEKKESDVSEREMEQETNETVAQSEIILEEPIEPEKEQEVIEPTQQSIPQPSPTEAPKVEVPTYQTCFVVNCQESITLRTEPSTKAAEICQIPLGAPVSYVETAENGFYKIIYNGKTGYGLASYLSFDDGTENAIFMQVVNCQESITLRKVPSTSADEFCQIPLGAVVEFLGAAENGFYYVEYNGYDGYALASYLTEW